MLRPLREQMEVCVERLERGTLQVEDLRGLFTVILEALPSLAPPGRQIRHLVDLTAKLLGETAPHAVCRLANASLERAYLRFDDPGIILRQLHADQVFRYDHPNIAERCALCVEYQYRPDPTLLVLWLAKALILSDRLQMPVVLVVIYLHQGRFQSFPGVHIVQGGGLTNEFRFETIRLWEHVDRIRSGELVELAPLLVLCVEGNPEEILREERDLILKANLEPRVTTDLLGISYILGLRVESEGVVNAVFAQDELAEIKSQGLIGRWIQDAVDLERAAAAQRLEEERRRATDDRLAAARRLVEEQALAEQRLAAERAVTDQRLAAERAAAEQRLTAERTVAEQRLAAEQALAEQRLVAERQTWLLRVLQRRFSAVPELVEQRIRQADAPTCDTLLELAVGAASIEEFAQRM